MLVKYFAELWNIIAASAPALLLGLFLAGVIQRFLPQSLIERSLSQPGIKSVLLASALGAPLPLCSCSVIPVAVSLRRKGASAGATAAFFISTPEIGIDSFLLSYSLLGLPFAVARLIAAFITALMAGLFIDWLCAESTVMASEQEGKCCGVLGASKALLDDLAPLLAIGFLLSALCALPESLNLNTPFSIILMLALALPAYVCATSVTPLVAVLISKGLALGVALVLLLVGPATNLAMMLAVRRELGNRALMIYLSMIVLCAVVMGLLVNEFLEAPAVNIALHTHGSANQLAGIVLSGLIIFSLAQRKGFRRANHAH